MLLDLLRSMYQSSVPARTVGDVVHDTVKDNSSKIDYSHRLLASERRRRRRRRLKAWKRTARHLFIGHSRNACGLQCNFPHYIIINFPSILRPPLSLSLSLFLSRPASPILPRAKFPRIPYGKNLGRDGGGIDSNDNAQGFTSNRSRSLPASKILQDSQVGESFRICRVLFGSSAAILDAGAPNHIFHLKRWPPPPERSIDETFFFFASQMT